jgi:ferric-dicitrate binding protein FerR (iron transport regulator)
VVKVFSESKDKKNLKLKVQSKIAAIGVRGTEFFVYAEADKQMTTLREGKLEMIAARSAATLKFDSGLTVATNVKKQLIRPKKFIWQEQINWSTNESSKDLLQPEGLFSKVAASWNRYKDEQEFRYREYTKDMENKLNNWNKDNDKLRKSIFNN